VLALSLELSGALLGTPVPPTVQARLRPGAVTRLHLRLMRPASSLVGRGLRGIRPATSLLFWLSAGSRKRRELLLRLASGRQHAEQWIFREAGQGPPAARETVLAGLRSVLGLAAYQVSLHLGRLRRWFSA
jgi:hypothetical protein